MPNPDNETISFSVPKKLARKFHAMSLKHPHGWKSEQATRWLTRVTAKRKPSTSEVVERLTT